MIVHNFLRLIFRVKVLKSIPTNRYIDKYPFSLPKLKKQDYKTIKSYMILNDSNLKNNYFFHKKSYNF